MCQGDSRSTDALTHFLISQYFCLYFDFYSSTFISLFRLFFSNTRILISLPMFLYSPLLLLSLSSFSLVTISTQPPIPLSMLFHISQYPLPPQNTNNTTFHYSSSALNFPTVYTPFLSSQNIATPLPHPYFH